MACRDFVSPEVSFENVYYDEISKKQTKTKTGH